MLKMNEAGIIADSLTYTFLIDAYGRKRLLDCAFGVLKRMFDAGCKPCHLTYYFLIKHLSNVSYTDITCMWKTMDFEIALELLEKMAGHGCAPNSGTYGELITGLCTERNWEVAEKLFGKMRDMGIFPNEDTCNSLLDCCCELKFYRKPAMLVDYMIELGYLPALESCKWLICWLVDEESNEKANAFFCSMLHCGYNQDEVVWKLLLDGLVKRGSCQ